MPSTSFQRTWAITKTLGFMIGYLPYAPIRHGLTGNHWRQLTLSQLRPPTSLEQPPQENGEMRVDQSSLLLAALLWAGRFPASFPRRIGCLPHANTPQRLALGCPYL